jgi:hypothetical protein
MDGAGAWLEVEGNDDAVVLDRLSGKGCVMGEEEINPVGYPAPAGGESREDGGAGSRDAESLVNRTPCDRIISDPGANRIRHHLPEVSQ